MRAGNMQKIAQSLIITQKHVCECAMLIVTGIHFVLNFIYLNLSCLSEALVVIDFFCFEGKILLMPQINDGSID